MSSKQKQNGTVADAPVQQLSLVNFDDLDSLEIEETTPAQQSEQAPVATVETEDAILSTLEQFDVAFAGDPLKDEYREFAEEVHETVNPATAGPRYLTHSQKIYNLMVREFNIAPNGYDRAAVIRKCETALRLCGVPESMAAKPQEIASYVWIAKLDRSTPGADGEPRSFSAEEIPADWFGGNLKHTALRVLYRCIDRQSKNDEIDVWEFKDGFEAHVREWLKRLRDGHLSYRQIEKLIDFRKKTLAAERKAQKFQGLNANEIASIEASEKNESLQSKLTELGSLALKVQKFGAEELKKGPAEVRDFLANKGIIPPDRFPSVDEIAAHLTPGDAKALVQSLIKQYAVKPDRLPVFKTLYQTCKAVVAKLQASAQGEPVQKAG
jgi:hypothetical protein